MKRDALISDDGRLRHWLARIWDESKPLACVVMLNPSTADASVDDATIRKLIGFGERLGWGGFFVVNLYSYRATKPADLKRAGYPGQGLNDDSFIVRAALRAKNSGGPVICAWGANARGLERQKTVRRLLAQCGITSPMALRLLPDGIPEHPLMLPYTCTPVPLAA